MNNVNSDQISKQKNGLYQKAFTLIELAIVLVIIALIISGILIGSDLIKAAESRALISQIDRYNSAISAFKIKFGQLPGDFNGATTYISSTTINGDGNGMIYTAAGVPSATPTTLSGELLGFWNHLSSLNLIDGYYDNTITASITIAGNIPGTKINRGGIIAYGFTDYSNYYMVGAQNVTASDTIAVGYVLTTDGALTIDTKMDDGKPNTGIVQARGSGALEQAVNTASPNICATTATASGIYNTTSGGTSGYNCALRIRFLQ